MSKSIDEQRAWARASVLLVPAPERCVLEVTGSDRLSWLNGLLTCNLSSRAPGEAVLGLAVTQKGKIVSDVIVVVEEASVRLVVQRRTVDALLASFDHHLMMEDAELARRDDAVWFLHGPLSVSVLAAARASGVRGGALDATGAGGAVAVGEAGFVAALVAEAERQGGGLGDLDGWDAVRVRAGVPRFDVDFDDTTYPQEAGFEKTAVSFQKGCYLGQEVVCMLEMRGHVKRKLVSLDVEGQELPPHDAAVLDAAGATVGAITSAVLADGSVRALAMVKYAFIAEGTALKVLERPARVRTP
jgi:folate-binding protein YgfZ